MTNTVKQELRDKIVEILGLEVSPHNEPDYLLIRDESDRVLEGMSYAEEVDQILDLLRTSQLDIIDRALAAGPEDRKYSSLDTPVVVSQIDTESRTNAKWRTALQSLRKEVEL